MASDHAQRPGENFRGSSRRILMTDAVESVAPDSLLEPVVGTWVDIGRAIQRGMKRGVENGDLRDAEDPLAGLDRVQFVTVMFGRDLGLLGDRVANFAGDPGALTKFAAVDDSVAHHVDRPGDGFQDLFDALAALDMSLPERWRRLGGRIGGQIVE